MAKFCEHELSEELNHSQLSRSPSPTLIYPLTSAHLPGTDDIRDSTSDWSQNSHGALGSTLHSSYSQSPEERKLRQRERRSLKETSHMCRSFDNAAVACSTPSRSTVVTDIDEAMAHMDQMYLKTLFNDAANKAENCEANTDVTCSSSCNDDDTEETNIDDEPSSAMVMAIIRQKCPNSSVDANFTSPELKKGSSNGEHYISSAARDAVVKWPLVVPKTLIQRECQRFHGETLVKWLYSSFEESNYLHNVLTYHDFQIIIAQLCTCLLAAGVLNELENKSSAHVFKAQNQYSWSKEETVQDSESCDEIVVPSQVCVPFSLETNKDEKEIPKLECTCDCHGSLSEIIKEYKQHEQSLKEAHAEEINQLNASFSEQINRLTVQIQELENELRQYKVFKKTETTNKEDFESAGESCSKVGLNNDSTSLETTLKKLYRHQAQQTTSHQVSDIGTVLTSSSESCHSYDKSDTLLASCPTPAAASTVPQLSVQCSIYNNTASPPAAPFLSNEEVRPPPPPPPPFPPTIPMCPPPPPGPGGPPPPPPPGGSVLLQKQESSKPIINPKSPMKPLFWKRIQVQSVLPDKRSGGKNTFWEEISEEPINFQCFEELFAKTPVESKKKATGFKVKSKTNQPAKVIQPKRSQAVGILLSSLRLEFSDIEDAILNLDTSVLDIEKFKAIYDSRSDSEEMKMIKRHTEEHPEIPLDKPEQFLYDLEQIPFVKDRIFCFIFQSSFQESIAAIDSKLNNLKMTCEALSSSESVKRICGLILACGNYMNGGSRTRGQADGFDLEILQKLKDVKGKDNCTSLLQFVVSRYICKYDTNVLGTDRAKLPLPDPSDIQQAGLVNFDDTAKELKRIRKDFTSAEEKATNIIKFCATESLDPFKSVMTSFFDKGKQDLKEQDESIAECSKLFDSTCTFFCVKPKNREQSVTPEQFFSLWISFCSDFKDIWKKEQQAVMKIRIKEAEERVKTIKESALALPPTRAKKVGGLKDKLSRQGKL